MSLPRIALMVAVQRDGGFYIKLFDGIDKRRTTVTLSDLLLVVGGKQRLKEVNKYARGNDAP